MMECPAPTDLGYATFLTGAFMPEDPSTFFINEGNVLHNTEFVLKPHGIHVVLGKATAFERDYAMYRSTFRDPFIGTRYQLMLIIPYRLGSPFYLSWFDKRALAADHTRSCLLDLYLPVLVQVDSFVATEHEDSDTEESDAEGSDEELSEETDPSEAGDDTCGIVDIRPASPLAWVVCTPACLEFGIQHGDTAAQQMRHAHDQAFGVSRFEEVED